MVLNFAEQTGSGAVTMVWSFLQDSVACKYMYCSCKHVFTEIRLVFTEIRLVFKTRFWQSIEKAFLQKNNNSKDSNVVPHHSTIQAGGFCAVTMVWSFLKLQSRLGTVQKKHFKLCHFILALFSFKRLKLLFVLHENMHAIGLKFVHYVGVVSNLSCCTQFK